MVDKNILIKNLEDFKNAEKYSRCDLAKFLSKTDIIKDYYNECVKDILTYIKNNSSSIEKYIKECDIKLLLNNSTSPLDNDINKLEDLINHKKTYSPEDERIINDIKKRYLLAFYWYYDYLNKINPKFSENPIEAKLFIYGAIEDINRVQIIDNIIKKYLLSINTDIEEKQKFIINKRLSPQKELILKEILNGNITTDGIAQKLNNKKTTINTVLSKINRDIDDFNIPTLKNLKRSIKLLKFAELYFNQNL